jgi:hypothetical protein
MDPYLESPSLWPDVHARLASIIAEQLTPQIVPKYVAELETRVLIEQPDLGPDSQQVVIPDVPVMQTGELGMSAWGGTALAEPAPLQLQALLPDPVRLYTVQIRHREDSKLVTAIEILSPVNKRMGDGREEYIEKRQAYLASPVHLVEIDLLRRYPRMPFADPVPACDYLIAINRRPSRLRWSAWPVLIRQHLPKIPIPLLSQDPDATLDLKNALETAYDRARYDLRIDYTKPADPPLRAEDEAWMRQYLVPVD